MPGDVTGSLVYDARTGEFEFRARPGVHEHPARRRDQPHAPEDPGGAPRGDGGAPGLVRRREPAAARSVPRRRDAEPDRARGHLLAARGAARPLPDEARRRHARARRRGRRAAPARRRLLPARARPDLAAGGHAPTRSAPRSGPRHPSQVTDDVLGYVVDLARATRRSPLGAARARARAPRRRCSPRRRRGRGSSGYPAITPDHVQTMLVPVWRHRLRLRPDAEMEGVSVDAVLGSRACSRRGCRSEVYVTGRLACSSPPRRRPARAARRRAASPPWLALLGVDRAVRAAASRIDVAARRSASGALRSARECRARAARQSRSPRAASCATTARGACAGVIRDAWQPTAGRARAAGAASTCPPARRRRIAIPLLPATPRRARPAVRRRALRRPAAASRAGRRASASRGAIRVLPPFTSRRHLPSRLARLRELDGNTSVQVRGQGTEFDSLREYVRGDDVRSIDWRATARAGTTMLRTWRPERDRHVVIVIDTGRTAAARVGDGVRMDAAMEAALLLAALADPRRRPRAPADVRPRRARAGDAASTVRRCCPRCGRDGARAGAAHRHGLGCRLRRGARRSPPVRR